jgi:hypothetical protein
MNVIAMALYTALNGCQTSTNPPDRFTFLCTSTCTEAEHILLSGEVLGGAIFVHCPAGNNPELKTEICSNGA